MSTSSGSPLPGKGCHGDLCLVLLSLIAEKPRCGYEPIRELEEKFGGAHVPGPGSVCPNLTLLEELGHVRASTSEGTKRLFEITDEARNWLNENDAALQNALSRMNIAARAIAGDRPPAMPRDAMRTLRPALRFHRSDWNEAETERVCRIIEEAADAIARRP